MLSVCLMRPPIQHSRPALNNSDIKAVTAVLRSRYIASGRVTEEFEKRFARFIKVNSAAATNSGTVALHLALLALKIKANDEVILPSLVCSAVLDSVLYVKAKPRLADINLYDFNLSLEDTQKKITPRTKAIILPHIFGKPAEIPGFLKLGIPMIENCCHSLGAQYKDRPVGGFGEVSIFSFYATKMITTGYGGMVSSKDKNLILRIKDLINCDEREGYKLRFHYRISDMAAALGMNQLKRINVFISLRQAIAKFYRRNLSAESILLPQDPEKNHIYFRYVIRVDGNLERVIQRLSRQGIEAKRPIFRPLHHYLKLDKKDFPNTELVYNSALSLPVYPDLKKSEAGFIVASLKRALD